VASIAELETALAKAKSNDKTRCWSSTPIRCVTEAGAIGGMSPCRSLGATRVNAARKKYEKPWAAGRLSWRPQRSDSGVTT